MPYPALAVANYFIDRGVKEGNPVDPLKLQKLVYIAHGWHLAVYDQPLIRERVEAWQYGPVIPVLYHEFKQHGARPITEPAVELRGLSVRVPMVEPDDKETVELLDRIWGEYGNLTGVHLSNLTHQQGTPWFDVHGAGRKVIANEEIKKHYLELARQPA